uniref:Uncharacterized protein n=1 Tax=Cacopsylla melanoneura TaxID=428564 RepID=A0A8D9DUU1_9HEMI
MITIIDDSSDKCERALTPLRIFESPCLNHLFFVLSTDCSETIFSSNESNYCIFFFFHQLATIITTKYNVFFPDQFTKQAKRIKTISTKRKHSKCRRSFSSLERLRRFRRSMYSVFDIEVA